MRTRCPGFMISNVLDNFAHFTLADLRFSTRVDVLTDDNGFNSTFSGNQIPLSTNFFSEIPTVVFVRSGPTLSLFRAAPSFWKE